MSIEETFRIQTRSDLPDTLHRGLREGVRSPMARHFGAPAKATSLHPEAASSIWDSTFASMFTDRPRPTWRPQRAGIVKGSSGSEEGAPSTAVLQACRVVASCIGTIWCDAPALRIKKSR